MEVKKGSKLHKPKCQCPFCSRARTKEANLKSIGDGRRAEVLDPNLSPRDQSRKLEEILNADLPVLVGNKTTGRERIVQYLAIRAKNPDIKVPAAAALMGINANTLSSYITRATKQGWLRFDSPLERLEHEIMPKVVDNLNEFMDEKDRTATIEVFKHTLAKQYQESKGVLDKPTTILALKIETVDSSQEKVISGTIVGTPRILE